MPTANITIKKKTGSSEYTELYPTTIISQVTGLQSALDAKVNTSSVGQPSGVASLDANGKVELNQLPETVFDSLHFHSNFAIYMTSSPTANQLKNTATFFYNAIEHAVSAGRTPVGYYFIVSSGGSGTQIIATTSLTLDESKTINWGFSNIDGPFGGSANPSTSPSGVLEVGDWFIITKYTKISSTEYTIEMAVISNTTEYATTTSPGIVEISTSTVTGVSNSDVITNSVLNGLLAPSNTSFTGTTNLNKLAPAAHHHNTLYLGINSNATSASQWATARTVTFATGTVTGSFSIDGSADVGNVALTYTGNEFYYTEGEAAVGDLVFETDPA